MDSERWKKLDELFCTAVELTPDERAAFVERECGDDAELRNELESMLAHDGATADDLRESIRSAAQAVSAEDDDHWAGTTIGTWRIVEKVAEGGMGAVYLGERADEQYRQRVAIKLLSSGLISASAKNRFLSERQILANLNHPNIAQLLDGGTTDTGVPYLVMEYIDGLPIDQYCDRRRLTIRERLGLLREVCGAVQYAHRNLIVHRDIKPGNILVTDEGVPKLLDFGIAKLLDEDQAGHTIALTVADMRLLTPEYASPEQVLGEPVTTATDVYALGVLTYQLLAGRFPYTLSSRRPQELERVICTTDPERPSTVIADAEPDVVGRERRTTPARLRKQLRGDLDNIVMAAMRKEPERRYGTVRTLSEDIQRYLEDRPVLARPDTFQYRTGKFMSRHRYRLALAAVALVVVASLVGFYTWRLSAERDLVIQERDTAERTADFLVSLFEESDPEVSRGQSVSARELLDRGAENISGRLADEPQLRARLMYAMARVYFGLGQYDEADEFAVRVVDDLRRDDERSALSLADALILQGNIATARNDFENAGQYYERGLEIYRRETGDGDTNTLTALVAIGEMQFRYGRTAESIANCERANAGITGATDPARLTVSARAKLCLGRAYLIDARPDEAQAALEEARSILIGLHGDDHPDVAVAEHELGAVQHHLGNYPDAKAHYARSLEIMRRIYGESHTRLADPLTEMADVRSLTGDYEQAEKEIGEALDILRSKFGDDHTLVAISLHVKGNIMLDQGRNAEGEQLFRESLAILERLLEPKHEYFPMVLNGLASSLEFQGKFDEAETHYREAVRLAQAHQDPNYLDAIINVSNLGAMLASKGDFERALPFMQEAVERGVDNYGAEHPDVVIFKHAYGKALGYLERYDEASRILDEVGTDFRRIYGEDHYRYANWTSDRGQLCLAMNDLPCAERMLDDAIRMKEKILGTDHTSYAVTLYETARLQLAKGDPAEARRRAEQSLAILEASELPDTHINIVRTRTLLANL